VNQWFDTTVFIQPPAFTFGNVARTLPDVRDHGTNNMDFGLVMNNKFLKDGPDEPAIPHRVLNVFNRVRFGNPGLTFGSPQFGGERAQRRVQVDPDTRGIVSLVDGWTIALFFTGWKHAGENIAEVLKQRAHELPAPIQMCDALSRNTPKGVPT
jgi:hypothetical protein